MGDRRWGAADGRGQMSDGRGRMTDGTGPALRSSQSEAGEMGVSELTSEVARHASEHGHPAGWHRARIGAAGQSRNSCRGVRKLADVLPQRHRDTEVGPAFVPRVRDYGAAYGLRFGTQTIPTRLGLCALCASVAKPVWDRTLIRETRVTERSDRAPNPWLKLAWARRIIVSIARCRGSGCRHRRGGRARAASGRGRRAGTGR